MASLLYITSTENPADSPQGAPALAAAVGCARSGSSWLQRLHPAHPSSPFWERLLSGARRGALGSHRCLPSCGLSAWALSACQKTATRKLRKPPALAGYEISIVSVLTMAGKGTIFNANSFRLLFTSLARAPKSK